MFRQVITSSVMLEIPGLTFPLAQVHSEQELQSFLQLKVFSPLGQLELPESKARIGFENNVR